MNIEEQKKLLAMQSTTGSQLREGDRTWEGRLWEIRQAMNKKLIQGRQSGTRWHNTPKSRHSALEVNETLGRRSYQCLPTEISPAWRPAQAGSVHRDNTVDDQGEVSRSHSSWDKTNWGASMPV